MAACNNVTALASINFETGKITIFNEQEVLESLASKSGGQTNITIECNSRQQEQYSADFQLKITNGKYTDNSSVFANFGRGPKANTVIKSFLREMNQVRQAQAVKVEPDKREEIQIDMSKWDITTPEEVEVDMSKWDITTPEENAQSTPSPVNQRQQSAPHSKKDDKSIAKLPSYASCVETYRKMHDSTKGVNQVFRECSLQEFMTVMVHYPQLFNSFYTEMNRIDAKAIFIEGITKIRDQELLLATEQEIQFSIHNSDIKNLNQMNSTYLPGTASSTMSNATQAAKQVDFADEVTLDPRVCRKKIANLDSYKQHVDTSLKTLFVLDLDDTLSCRAILEKFRHGATITSETYFQMCGQVALHHNLREFLAELKQFGNGSRVILVTNAKGKYLNEKLEPTGLKQSDFDSVSALEDAPQGHAEGSKEARVLKDCKQSGFKPEQIVTFDDEDTHLRKIEPMSLNELGVKRSVSLHVKTAVPSRHGEAAVSSFVFDGRNDTYANFLYTLYHNSYLEKNGTVLLDDKGHKIRDTRFLLERQEYDSLLK